MIVPSYVGCTFCSPPNLRQVVFVTQGGDDSSGKTYPFIEEPSYVTVGTFRISLPESNHEGKKQGFVYSIEDAEVTVHTGEAPKRASVTRLPELIKRRECLESLICHCPADLIPQVAKLLGQKPLQAIIIQRVSAQEFGQLVWNELQSHLPKSVKRCPNPSFQPASLAPEGIDWLQILTGLELVDEPQSPMKTVRVSCPRLDSNRSPLCSLELVGAITDGLLRQRIRRMAKTTGRRWRKTKTRRRARKSLRLESKKPSSEGMPYPRVFLPKSHHVEFKPSVTVDREGLDVRSLVLAYLHSLGLFLSISWLAQRGHSNKWKGHSRVLQGR